MIFDQFMTRYFDTLITFGALVVQFFLKIQISWINI